MGEFHKTGLDVIFYGQEHYDTMAIVSERHQPRQDEIGQLLTDQKLLSNKDLLSRNFSEVIQNLDDCDQYIQTIIVSILSSRFVSLLIGSVTFYKILVSNNFGMLINRYVGKWWRG